MAAAADPMETLSMETMEEGGLYNRNRRIRNGKRGRERATGVAGMVGNGASSPRRDWTFSGVVLCAGMPTETCDCCMQSPSTIMRLSSPGRAKMMAFQIAKGSLRHPRSPGQQGNPQVRAR